MSSALSLDDNVLPNEALEEEDAAPASQSSRRRERRERRRGPKKIRPITTLIFHPVFIVLFGLLGLALMISFFLVLNHPENVPSSRGVEIRLANQNRHDLSPSDLAELQMKLSQNQQASAEQARDHLPNTIKAKAKSAGSPKLHGHQPKLVPKYDPKPFDAAADNPHLHPLAPPLPIFPTIPNSQQLIDDLIHHNKPTVAGIIAFFYQYLDKLHALHKENAKDNQMPEMDIITNYFKLTQDSLTPLEQAYRGRTIFPIREEEDAIFVSLAAFREHLLAPTLMSALDQAEHPEKLYFGAVIQNCFGLNGTVCRTGLQVIGKNAEGKDQVKMSDAPPDENGIETFCKNRKYKQFCDNGHIRVIYLHDTDALGPATARYYASKLWGGEKYFMQMDSHLEFAKEWDRKYKEEVQLARNYPKAILSAYPPGFSEFNGQFQGGSPGGRLCTCEFSQNGVENHIIRINQFGNTPKDAERPTQIAFIAAGFFFAHSSFLQDVPFDPYVPWCFMGEEIALSVRAWTNGWNIYAPRKSLIAHQYRPGRLGLPKFWESVGRDAGRPALNTKLQKHVIRRIKHMVGYTDDTPELIEKDGDGIVLTDYEHYSLGNERSLQDYLKLTKIDVVNQKCQRMGWCEKAILE
ncbi:glycosyltransferase GlcNAc [Nitzschia inconspicua]|uniref:Glycosyltransferase GlcNAc n=1 Tax=Nitzschia inconspicua TaxID=303405 RepID=A0A9K3PLE9_9STRA|nr:glycosyltransferase GlcNAc [Nitzschia inconspicua]